MRVRLCLSLLMLVVALPQSTIPQPFTYAEDAQHSGLSSAPAQHLNATHWSVNAAGPGGHFSGPVITPSNTVIVCIGTNSGGFRLAAFEGRTGRLKYALDTGFSVASWGGLYQPLIVPGAAGLRLYYAGPGGTIFFIENPDSDAPAPVQQCFYTDLATYNANSSNYNRAVFIDTPLTADTNGNIFFGYTIQMPPPAPLNNSTDGCVRIDAIGNATYVEMRTAAADGLATHAPPNCAPALSLDGSTLYICARNTECYSYLLGLDSTTLATKYKTRLLDPRNGNNACLSGYSAASPMIGPDGDVFLGVMANPDNGYRGFLLHFSSDLQTRKLPGGFGWDNTAAVIPASVVASYRGPSPYLIFTKYNNYAMDDGDGLNKIAILDPNSAQVDPHRSASGLLEMREVLSVIGPTVDAQYYNVGRSNAVREWCIYAATVNPATASIFAPNEDGRLYRWDLAADSLSEVVNLPQAIGEVYVPSAVGPDGAIYTFNAPKFLALGNLTNFVVRIFSSAPDLRSFVAGQPVTFTAVVTNVDPLGVVPSGSITFQDVTYRGTFRGTNVIAAGVALTNGVATVTTSSFIVGGNYPTNCLGSHFITAIYSGDGTFPSATATLVQKVHASATTTFLSASPPTSNNTVTLTATVSPVISGLGAPTGFVSFWDGSNCLGQVALKTNRTASIVIPNPSGTNHSITAIYVSDTLFAASAGSLSAIPPYLKAVISQDGTLQLSFSNLAGAPFSVLGATDFGLPVSNWPVLGPAQEVSPGQFRFTDGSSNYLQRYYRVRSP